MATASRINAAYLHEVAHDDRTSVREDLAVQLAQFINGEDITKADRKAVAPVLATLANDPVASVRQRLGAIVASSAHAPREVLRILVCDVDEISLPVLENTPAMPEADLASVVKAGPLSRQMAIARRSKISARLSRIIINMCCEEVCALLLDNTGAQIDKAGFERLVDRHGDKDVVREALDRRGSLPVHITAKIVAKMPNSVVPMPGIEALPSAGNGAVAITEDRNQTVLKLIRASTDDDLRDLVAQFYDSEVLTASLILRAAFIGHIDFVVEAMSVLAGVPAKRVRSLLLGKARLGARAIYLRAGLPPEAFRAIRVALDVFVCLRPGGATSDEAGFGRKIIERVATDHVDIAPDERKYLLDLMARLGPEGSRDLAAQLANRLAEAA